MKALTSVFKAFIYAVNFAFVKLKKRKFYASMMAYICTVGAMRTDDDKVKSIGLSAMDNEFPSIYELDAIVNKMNDERDDINKVFHLSVVEWTRNYVRGLMDAFNFYHEQISKLRQHDMSLKETILAYVESSPTELHFWQVFKSMFAKYVNENTLHSVE